MSATSDTNGTVVTDNPAQQRFDLHVDGEHAGFAAYYVTGDRVAITHTRVFEAYEGQGLASILTRSALDSIRAEGSPKVVPECWYTAMWIDRHPDYQDLLADRG